MLPTIRFYFDGLVVNFLVPKAQQVPGFTEPAPLTTADGDLVVILVSAEHSYQMRNYKQVLDDAAEAWPDQLDALFRTSL